MRALREPVIRWSWWPLLMVGAFILYSSSFNSFPILEREHSVLADADAAAFALLQTQFAPARHYGDEYAPTNRTVADIAQKHKGHHFLYFLVGGTLYEVLHGVRRILGLDAHQALYEVNALIACVNLLVLGVLLRRLVPEVHPAPYLALYGVALSTWIYHAIPESWPFSATLALGFLWLAYVRSTPWWALAVYIGAAMLNNFLLGALGALLCIRELGAHPWRTALRRTGLAAGIVILTWLGLLTVFSPIEPGLRPDRFIAYTLWFKRHMGAATLPLSDPYVWESALTNLFVNSVVSQQPDPAVPQEALLTTLRSSWLGRAAVAAWIGVATVAAMGAWRSVRSRRRGGVGAVLSEPVTQLAVFCGVYALAVIGMFFNAGFLYSTVVLPLLVLCVARWLPGNRRWRIPLVTVLLILVAMNNAVQVSVFRSALRGLS